MPSNRDPRPADGEYKVVLPVRRELRLLAGKAAVQAAHAAVMRVEKARSRDRPALSAWVKQVQKKIAKRAIPIPQTATGTVIPTGR